MKRNFNVIVRDFDGHPFVRPVMQYAHDTGMPIMENGAHAFSHHEPMTLRLYALDALAGRWRGEEGLTNDDLWKRMKLHDKLAFAGNEPVEITSDEGKMVLDALNKQGRSPIVIGRMKDLIDTDPAPAADPTPLPEAAA